MKYIYLISFLLISLAANGDTKSKNDNVMVEVSVEDLSNLKRISDLYIHESHENMLHRVAQTHLFYELAKENDPDLLKKVIELNLRTMKADLNFLINSKESSELQRKRAMEILNNLKKTGVIK